IRGKQEGKRRRHGSGAHDAEKCAISEDGVEGQKADPLALFLPHAPQPVGDAVRRLVELPPCHRRIALDEERLVAMNAPMSGDKRGQRDLADERGRRRWGHMTEFLHWTFAVPAPGRYGTRRINSEYINHY